VNVGLRLLRELRASCGEVFVRRETAGAAAFFDEIDNLVA